QLVWASACLRLGTANQQRPGCLHVRSHRPEPREVGLRSRLQCCSAALADSHKVVIRRLTDAGAGGTTTMIRIRTSVFKTTQVAGMDMAGSLRLLVSTS